MAGIVIVTATFYTEQADLDVRLPLAIATVRAAAARRLPVLAVDGSPDPEVRRVLEDAGAEVITQKEPGFGPAVRQAVMVGRDMVPPDGFVCWQEPEKVNYVGFLHRLVAAGRRQDAAIVVPKRTEVSWKTYPVEQRYQERFINAYIRIISGGKLAFDLTHGPKLFRVDATELVLQYNGGAWDAHMVPVARAVKLGMRVISVPVGYPYPLVQRRAEEGVEKWCRKRLVQVNTDITTVEQAWLAS